MQPPAHQPQPPQQPGMYPGTPPLGQPYPPPPGWQPYGQPPPGWQPYGGPPPGPGAPRPPQPRRSKTGLVLILVLLGVLIVGGLVARAAGGTSVPSYQVEGEIAVQLGVLPQQVDCPNGLTSEVGATMTCTGPVDGVVRPLLIRVTSVEGNTTNFEITPQ